MSWSSFSELQDRAKRFFNDAPNTTTENVTQLLQLIEDFCREGDKLVEEEKQIKRDLQEQVCILTIFFFVNFIIRPHSQKFVIK